MIGFDSNLLLIVLLLSFSVYLLIDYRSNNAPHDN
jgi:hypothetical protein